MPNYIKMLTLEGHEEGGYFSLFYKSKAKVIPQNPRYSPLKSSNGESVERSACSSIYFLLEKTGFSAWHRLRSDEIWHYYDGASSINIYTINEEGQLETYILGNPGSEENAAFQIIIKAGLWFTAEITNKKSYGLVGCTVLPGFEYEDFELANGYKKQLLQQYPHLSNILNKFIDPNIVKLDTQKQQYIAPPFSGNKFSAKDYINKLNLKKHPLGGYYRINYKATDQVVPVSSRCKPPFKNHKHKESTQINCSAGSAIYFLLNKQEFLEWHQLHSDEIWHYYDGSSPLEVHIINGSGELRTIILGNPCVVPNATFQTAIKSGEWFAAEVQHKHCFGLVGCTISSEIEHDDLIINNKKSLLQFCKNHGNLIKRLSHDIPVTCSSWTTKAIKYATRALIAGIGLYTVSKGHRIFSANVDINTVRTKLGM